MTRPISRRRFALVAAALGAVAAPAGARAQAVLLQIHPRVGDTLHVRLEQESQLTGARRTPTGESRTTTVTTMQVFSHTIVEGWAASGATVVAVTDSALVVSSDPHSGAPKGKPMRIPGGRSVRVHVSPTGTMELAEDGRKDEAELASMMPAAFPPTPVTVGDSWTRTMAVPAPFPGAPRGELRATFHFDSLARGGDFAWVSMRGEVRPEGEGGDAGAATLEGSGGDSRGSVSGFLVLDRRRGWLTESHFAITAQTTVVPRPQPGTAAVPMHFQIRVTQRLRTTDRP